jgi:hypothetical protein
VKISADDYAATYSASLNAYQALRPRSLQEHLGVSDLGYCASKALYKLSEVEATDAPVSRSALMGTAAHDLGAAARKAFNPALLVEVELSITLPSGIVITGHADEIDPNEPSVTDLKTVADEAALLALRKTGSTEQQRFQRQLYYLGAAQAGLVPEVGTVRNVWVDRAGQADWCYVEQEPFDINTVHAADRWLEDVIYAAKHGEEAPRDKHFDHCRSYCEFFTHCRGHQAHGDFLITDPEMVTAAQMVVAGRAQEKEAKGLSETGKRVLAVLQQSAEGDVASFEAEGFRIRWTKVNGEQRSYWKLDVAEQDVA